IVVDTETAAHNGPRIPEWLPREAHPGLDVVPVRIPETAGLAGLSLNLDIPVCRIEIRQLVVLLNQRREVFITHADVQCEVGAQLPIVLGKAGIHPVSVEESRIEWSALCERWYSQQQIGHGIAAGQRARLSVECE